MVCCLFLFSGDPLDNNPKNNLPNKFQVNLYDGCQYQPTCCCAYCCAPCCAFHVRKKVLDYDMTKYQCCQGYSPPCCCGCCVSGKMNEQSCPNCCLCMESFCCLGPAMSSSRMFAMDKWQIRPDPMDNRLVRMTNCCLMAACICDCFASCVPQCKEFASLLDTIASCIFHSVMGCMVVQLLEEVKFQKKEGGAGGQMPVAVPFPGDSPYATSGTPYSKLPPEQQPLMQGQQFNGGGPMGQGPPGQQAMDRGMGPSGQGQGQGLPGGPKGPNHHNPDRWNADGSAKLK